MEEQVLLDVAEPAVLDDDEQLPLVEAGGAGAQQVEDVEVLAQVDHDLELGHQRLDVGDVRMRLDHLDRYRGHLLPGHDALGFCFHHTAEGSAAKLH